jgi:hypothetical protein
VLLFAIPNIMNALMWITFAPISTQVQATYGVSNLEVSMCSCVFMIVYVFVDSPANYILDTYGIRPGVSLPNCVDHHRDLGDCRGCSVAATHRLQLLLRTARAIACRSGVCLFPPY